MRHIPSYPKCLSVKAILVVAIVLAATVRSTAFGADAPPSVSPAASDRIGDYVLRDVMIPTRDGVRLHAQVWSPFGNAEPLPILMVRSPYGFGIERVRQSFDMEFKELAQERFIFVLEDIRGRFGSEGSFVMLRPKSKSGAGIDESTDTYDTIDWLVTNIANNNGKVGVFGISYMGWTAAMAAVNPHPALRAISVQASPEDMFMGDDFHHNGAFRLDYGWEYAVLLESNAHALERFNFGSDDTYSWFLKPKSLSTLDRDTVGRTLPTWQNFVAHPNYDEFWKSAVTSRVMPPEVKVPNLIVAGWWDQEDFYGPLEIYRHQELGDRHGRNFLVIGPWNHAGWGRSVGRTLGPLNFGADTGVFFRKEIESRWFAYWLKGSGALNQPEALVFQTGSNRWRQYSAWPPTSGIKLANLFLHANGRLSFAAPTPGQDDVPTTYLSDPADPVPYRERPISPVMATDSTWPEWLVDDQAPFAARKDVATWQTEALASDLAISGSIQATLHAATSGSDSDWIVKLIDVYPDTPEEPAAMRARALLIAGDVIRGRFRQGAEHPLEIEPMRILRYDIDLHAASHVFRKGHRIMIQIQSSWFPLIDRNPQVFSPSIYTEIAGNFRVAHQSVYHSTRWPTKVALPIELPE